MIPTETQKKFLRFIEDNPNSVYPTRTQASMFSSCLDWGWATFEHQPGGQLTKAKWTITDRGRAAIRKETRA